MQERDPAPSREAKFFSDTLSDERAPLRYGLSAPLGLTAHGLALAAIALFSMMAIPEPTAPEAGMATMLRFAPPPPPTLIRGTTPESSSASVADAVVIDTAPSFVIPHEMLDTSVPMSDISIGYDNGFDDGNVQGMAGGLPGGVVGGVPGGLVDGLIGGTGNQLPEFPTPDVGPKPIRMPPASYSEAAIRESVRGSVKLRVVITEQGKVEVLDVLRSIPELDAEAIRTVESKWRFEPATKNGRPVPCLSDLVVRFNLY